MQLKPQDLLAVLKLVAIGDRSWDYAGLSVQLHTSPSQLHAAIKRALKARLAVEKGGKIGAHIRNLEEFMLHGLQYVFVPERGEMTRGVPTLYAAPPLQQYFLNVDEPPPVWPYVDGQVRGMAFSPLYKLAPQAALADLKLYELLVLTDALRGGQARERGMAEKELRRLLKAYA